MNKATVSAAAAPAAAAATDAATNKLPKLEALTRRDVGVVASANAKKLEVVYASTKGVHLTAAMPPMLMVKPRLGGEGNAGRPMGEFTATRAGATFSAGFGFGGKEALVGKQRAAARALYARARDATYAAFDERSSKMVEPARHKALESAIRNEFNALRRDSTMVPPVTNLEQVRGLMRDDATVRERVLEAARMEFADGVDIKVPNPDMYDDLGRLLPTAPLKASGKKHNFTFAIYLAWRVWPFTDVGFAEEYEDVVKRPPTVKALPLTRENWPAIVRAMDPYFYYAPMPMYDREGNAVPHATMRVKDAAGNESTLPDPFTCYIAPNQTGIAQVKINMEITADKKKPEQLILSLTPVGGIRVLQRMAASAGDSWDNDDLDMSMFADAPPISAVDPASLGPSGVDAANLPPLAGGKRDAGGATAWDRDAAQDDYSNY